MLQIALQLLHLFFNVFFKLTELSHTNQKGLYLVHDIPKQRKGLLLSKK